MLTDQDRSGCEGWTWTDEENTVFVHNCLMFSALGQQVSAPNCVRKEFSIVTTEPKQTKIFVLNKDQNRGDRADSHPQRSPELPVQQRGAMLHQRRQRGGSRYQRDRGEQFTGGLSCQQSSFLN